MGLFSRPYFLSVQYAAKFALVVKAVQDGDVAGIRNLVGQEVGEIQALFYTAATNDVPPWVALKWNGGGMFVMSGIATARQAFNVAQGYVPLDGSIASNPHNTYFETTADYIVGVLQGKQIGYSSTMFFGGHSAGGAVAQNLLSKWRDVTAVDNGLCMTYGSPKPGGLALAQRIFDGTNVRWMWEQDPVPLVVPRFEDAPWWVSRLDSIDRGPIPYYVQPKGGIVIKGTGQLVAGTLPTFAGITPFTDLAAWLWSFYVAASDKHSIDLYYNRLNALIPAVPTDQGPSLRLGLAEKAQTTSAREMSRAEVATVQTIVTAEHRQNAVPTSIPTPQAFTASRQGRIWLVSFGGQTVAMTANKRSARGLARQFNAALQRLQRQAVVDPQALQTQMQAYLEAAADPASGFTPTLNTTYGQ